MRKTASTKPDTSADDKSPASRDIAKYTPEEEVSILRDSIPNMVLEQLRPFAKTKLVAGCIGFMAETIKAVSPRDPLERMLVQQLMWCHQRIARLSLKACNQSDLEPIKVINELTDQAMNSYRRLMLALREYRAPHRQVNIKQLNQAEQQNIVQVETPNSNKGNATNEKDANHGHCEADTGQPQQPRSLEGTQPGRA